MQKWLTKTGEKWFVEMLGFKYMYNRKDFYSLTNFVSLAHLAGTLTWNFVVRGTIQPLLIENSLLLKSDNIHSFEKFLSVFSAYCFRGCWLWRPSYCYLTIIQHYRVSQPFLWLMIRYTPFILCILQQITYRQILLTIDSEILIFAIIYG